MRAVLRIALAYGAVTRPQRWLNVAGATFLAFAVLFAAIARAPQGTTFAIWLAAAGLFLVAIVPMLLGGAALRHASSQSMLHLRPYGRIRMLAGATLTITALAATVLVPGALEHLSYLVHGFAPQPEGPRLPARMLATSWGFVALTWVCVFGISGSRYAAFLPMALPLVVMAITKYFDFTLPDPLITLGVGFSAWMLLAFSYLKANSFRPTQWAGSLSTPDFESTPLGMVVSGFDSSRGPASRRSAINQLLLGIVSPFRHGLVTSAFFLLLVFAAPLLTRHDNTNPALPPEFVMSFISMMGAFMAWKTTHRARFLWLRACTDRKSLFAMAERTGLLTVLLATAVMGAAVAAITLMRQPENIPAVLLFAASQMALCTCMFYGGMSLTHGWTAEDILLCIGLGALFVIQGPVLQPVGKASMAVTLGAAGVYLLLAALLRVYARHSWLKLDWRIVRVPSMIRRGA